MHIKVIIERTPWLQVDANKAITMSAYYLYALKDNKKISWDGKNLSGLKKPVMITLGYSIKRKLVNELKVPLTEKNISIENQFELLLSKDIDAIAGQ